jgi:hypothetical protein
MIFHCNGGEHPATLDFVAGTAANANPPRSLGVPLYSVAAVCARLGAYSNQLEGHRVNEFPAQAGRRKRVRAFPLATGDGLIADGGVRAVNAPALRLFAQ